jgi:hypothetical protein
MGLDQYAVVVDKEADINDPDVEKTEIAYWRKHPNLQGWMEELYHLSGGNGEFNCAHVEIEESDLDRLKEDVESETLPETTGFFFGSNSDLYNKEKDLKFIADARAAIKEGKRVYYYSWW